MKLKSHEQPLQTKQERGTTRAATALGLLAATTLLGACGHNGTAAKPDASHSKRAPLATCDAVPGTWLPTYTETDLDRNLVALDLGVSIKAVEAGMIGNTICDDRIPTKVALARGVLLIINGHPPGYNLGNPCLATSVYTPKSDPMAETVDTFKAVCPGVSSGASPSGNVILQTPGTMPPSVTGNI